MYMCLGEVYTGTSRNLRKTGGLVITRKLVRKVRTSLKKIVWSNIQEIPVLLLSFIGV